jgi:hypothetical protein
MNLTKVFGEVTEKLAEIAQLCEERGVSLSLGGDYGIDEFLGYARFGAELTFRFKKEA